MTLSGCRQDRDLSDISVVARQFGLGYLSDVHYLDTQAGALFGNRCGFGFGLDVLFGCERCCF